MPISLITLCICLPFHWCLVDFPKFCYSAPTKLISGVVVRLPSFFQLGIFLPYSSLVRNGCISIVHCVARPLLCNARILCLLCLLTAVWSAGWWPVGETYRQLDYNRGTEILRKIRDGTGILTHKLHVICGFRSVASTVPMTVLKDTSSAWIWP